MLDVTTDSRKDLVQCDMRDQSHRLTTAFAVREEIKISPRISSAY